MSARATALRLTHRGTNPPMQNKKALQLQFDQFELNEGNVRLTRNGKPVPLAPKAFDVLCALLRQPGQLMTKDELLNAVWGHQHVSESVLKTVISELRAALSDDPRQPRYIETVSRRGYRFVSHISAPAERNVDSDANPFFTNGTTAPSIIGRRMVLDKLNRAWDLAVSGQRRIFWIAGEAGVGKTTLIDHFAAGLGKIRRAYGQCVEQFGAGEPYLPVLEALASLCRDDPALGPLLRQVAPTWLLQLPWLSSESERESLRRELAGTSQDRMLRELGELLDRYSQPQPLLLVTEDLHWSDHATVHLINHVARRRNTARLMWLASFRLAEVISEDHPLKGLRHELRMHRLCDEVVLDPFSEQDIADYIDDRFPDGGVSETFVRALHARTDGLPLFVVNVIDHLAAQGLLQLGTQEARADTAIAQLQVPENLAGVIDKQIGRLSTEQRTLLEAASVCGVEFRPLPVADALKREYDWVVDHCNELTRRQQWLSGAAVGRLHDGSLDARYVFRHALYRHVFYQRIGALARARLHGDIAASLERSRAAGAVVAASELATHFELSHEVMAALRYYAEAAENALRHFAPREAMDLTTHALSLLTGCPVSLGRDALELALVAMRGVAAAQLFGVSTLDTKRAFERALELLDVIPQHPLRSLVLHGLGLVLLVRGEYAASRALGERAHALFELHGDRVLLLSACSLLGQVNALQGKPYEAHEWLAQGVAACKALGDETIDAAFVVDPGVTMYAAFAIPLLSMGFADQARASLESARTRARRLGQPMAEVVALWFSALFEVRVRNPQRVKELAEALRVVVEDAALAQGDGPSRWFRGWAEAHLGSPQAAYRLIRDAYDHNAAIGMYSGSSEVLCYAAEALFLAGDRVAARAQLEEAMQFAQKLAERVYLTPILLLRARIELAQGESDAARVSMQEALREARSQRSVWMTLTALMALCELDSPRPEDFEALIEVCASLTEGFDTIPVASAQALLRAHRASRPNPV